MSRSIKVGLATVAFLTVGLALATPTPAHTPDGTTFRAGWQERDVYYYLSGSAWINIGGIADRVHNGAAQWSYRPGADFRYRHGGARSLSFLSCPSSPNVNGIFWEAYPASYPGERAQTAQCTYVSNVYRIYASNIRFKGDLPDWYTGTQHPYGAVDLWSYTTHEFGHAAGFFMTGSRTSTHWEQYDPQWCPSGDTRHTMCGNILPETGMMRSPALHDSDTFDARY